MQNQPQIQMKEKTRVDDRNMSIDETISKYRDFLDEDLIKLHKRNDETITKYRDYLDEDIIKQVVHSQDAPGPSRSIKEPVWAKKVESIFCTSHLYTLSHPVADGVKGGTPLKV